MRARSAGTFFHLPGLIFEMEHLHIEKLLKLKDDNGKFYQQVGNALVLKEWQMDNI